METEERLRLLEAKLEAYDTLIARLVKFAQSTPKGRIMLKVLGLG